MRQNQSAGLQQIPQVSVEVSEDSHRAVALLPWLANEYDAALPVTPEITPEVVGMEKQEHPSAGLIADTRLLIWIDGSRKQQPGLCRAGRRHQHPSLILGHERRVFEQFEVEALHVEIDRLVVVAYDQGDMRY